MTVTHFETQKTRISIRDLMVVVGSSAIIILTLFASGEIRSRIISGIRLSAFCIVPSIYPFLILSDFITSIKTERGGTLAKIFEKTFKISNAALPAFICGCICGFPVGVKIAADLYQNGYISKNECERLIGFSNTPSIAFIISGIGIGMYNNAKYGLILYISIFISSVISGFLFRDKNSISVNFSDKHEQTFDITNSVKSAGLSCVFISSYIIFFSAAIGVLSKFITNDTQLTLLTLALEITNTAESLSLLTQLPENFKLSLTAFALSFSGLCIAMQTRSILPKEIAMKKYYKIKISSAAIAFFITYLLMNII